MAEERTDRVRRRRKVVPKQEFYDDIPTDEYEKPKEYER
jgi:hypothetical protein